MNENNDVKLTKLEHEGDPRLAGELVDGVETATISLLQLTELPPAQSQTPTYSF